MNLTDLLLRNIDVETMCNVDFYPNKMTTTYDKTGGNSDGSDFMRWDDGKPIICDVKGPGAIVRFYVARSGGTLRFFFDDEDAPRLEIVCADFFEGKTYPFLNPLVGPRGLGYYCFFPMPFAKGCRIECVPDEDGVHAIYCQATHIEFPAGTEVKTFDPALDDGEKAALDKVLAAWNNPGVHPMGERPGQITTEKTLTIPAGETVELTTLEGSGIVDELYLKLNAGNTDLLRLGLLRAYWDGLMRPGIDSPIGDFFGNAFEFRPFKSLLTGLTENGEYYSFFPMPFNTAAKLELVNDSEEELSDVEFRVVHRKTISHAENIGRFHAKWRREYCPEIECSGSNLTGEYNYTILDATGQGKYIGCSMNMVNNWPRWWGEGDEMIFVDDDTWPPSHHGTGTEEYFNDAWGFHDGICPVSAAMLAGPEGTGSGNRCYGPNALFTHHMANALPFSKRIRVTIEHGTENDKSNDYATTAYWYQKVPGRDIFIMPRPQERLAIDKDKWIERYPEHREAFVKDRLDRIKTFRRLMSEHPTNETNVVERIRALVQWHYYFRMVGVGMAEARTMRGEILAVNDMETAEQIKAVNEYYRTLSEYMDEKIPELDIES
ncbi:glycoside hydrolase family 172 protein [Candidatus Hydrogenedentota bacterium]